MAPLPKKNSINQDSEFNKELTQVEKLTDDYEQLREKCISNSYREEVASGQGVVLSSGLATWISKHSKGAFNESKQLLSQKLYVSGDALPESLVKLGEVIAEMIIPSKSEVMA